MPADAAVGFWCSRVACFMFYVLADVEIRYEKYAMPVRPMSGDSYWRPCEAPAVPVTSFERAWLVVRRFDIEIGHASRMHKQQQLQQQCQPQTTQLTPRQ